MPCPLCGEEKSELVSAIAKKDLVSLYNRKFNFDVGYLFPADHVELLKCRVCGLKYFSPYAGGDDKFYSHFQKYAWYYEEEKDEFSFAASFIKENDAVLEVGGGRGVFAGKIAKASYTGLEYSTGACAIAARTGVNIINESVENYALRHREYYDVVCNFQVLEHVRSPFLFLKSSVECLKKGGLLIVSVPSDDSFFKSTVNAYLNLPPHHASRWSDSTLRYLSGLFNLEVVTIYHEKLSRVHYRWYARVLVENTVRNFFRRKFREVDLSIAQKLIKFVGLALSPFVFLGKIAKIKPTGHSVVVVYKKI